MRRFNPEKELYKIQNGNRYKIIDFVVLLLTISLISYSFALYQVRYSKRIIYTKVAPFSSKDLDLAIYVDGKEDELPEKGKGYYYESITCDDDPNAEAGWDYENWKLGAISVTIPNKCDIHFTSHPTTLIEQIKYANTINSDMVIDDKTKDNNLRYIGPNPDNYIWFNCDNYNNLTQETASIKCEKWRIIGLMNNMTIVDENTTEETKNQSLVKIIRAESIDSMPYDSAGTNNWANASLQKSLNTTYYNDTKLNNAKGITLSTQKMIENVIWNLGGWNTYDITAQQFYEYERGEKHYGSYPITWEGKIALIYPSDYGYAASGGNNGIDRITCSQTSLWHYNNGCPQNNWLYNNKNHWMLTPESSVSNIVFFQYDGGLVGHRYTTASELVFFPSLYLKSNTIIVNGDGSEEIPFILTQ